MPPELTAYLPLIVLGLAVLVLAAWLLARSNRKARVVEDGSAAPLARDVLDEGAERARRNNALIDAPRDIEVIEGPLSAAANTQAVAAATMDADAEAGAATVPTMTAPAGGAADDLTRIKGLGPKLADLLGQLGVTTYAQIAAWDASDVERIDAQLGRFRGRITRDQWVEQARLLSAGDESGFVAQYGRNG